MLAKQDKHKDIRLAGTFGVFSPDKIAAAVKLTVNKQTLAVISPGER